MFRRLGRFAPSQAKAEVCVVSQSGLSQIPLGFSSGLPVLPRFDPRALPRIAVRPFQRQLPLGLDWVAERTDAPESGQRAARLADGRSTL